MKRLVRVPLWLLLSAVAACGRETSKLDLAKAEARANLLRAYFTTPLKAKDTLSGFWTVNPEEFKNHIQTYQQQNSGSVSDKKNSSTGDSRYFLRIDGLLCDELLFVDGGELTVSAGTLKKLERTRDRIVYSVVFSRRAPGGVKFSQGAILHHYSDEKRVLLEFPNHKLTFTKETTPPKVLGEQYSKGS